MDRMTKLKASGAAALALLTLPTIGCRLPPHQELDPNIDQHTKQQIGKETITHQGEGIYLMRDCDNKPEVMVRRLVNFRKDNPELRIVAITRGDGGSSADTLIIITEPKSDITNTSTGTRNR